MSLCLGHLNILSITNWIWQTKN